MNQIHNTTLNENRRTKPNKSEQGKGGNHRFYIERLRELEQEDKV
jgi:hypothetical protein